MSLSTPFRFAAVTFGPPRSSNAFVESVGGTSSLPTKLTGRLLPAPSILSEPALDRCLLVGEVGDGVSPKCSLKIEGRAEVEVTLREEDPDA